VCVVIRQARNQRMTIWCRTRARLFCR
jgi:hypothetical protein